MNGLTTAGAKQDYVLGRTSQEHERLREQARVWEVATGRLLDRIEVAEGARCLDVGCGPGETMRLLAQRVGPTGHVLGIDVDEQLGAQALAELHAAGHDHCGFTVSDVEDAGPVPDAPYDVVYARLLLFHVQDPVAVLRRLWSAVAPGGHLVVHDYDVSTADVLPRLETMEQWRRVVLRTFTAAGRNPRIGHQLPSLFASAGIGAPDATDVAGRLESLRAGAPMLRAVHRSLLPAATSSGVTTVEDGERWVEGLDRDLREHGDDSPLWPLMIGAWKRRAGA